MITITELMKAQQAVETYETEQMDKQLMIENYESLLLNSLVYRLTRLAGLVTNRLKSAYGVESDFKKACVHVE